LAEECGQMLTNFFLQRRGKKLQNPHPTNAVEATPGDDDGDEEVVRES
jgi:hypothetical protein